MYLLKKQKNSLTMKKIRLFKFWHPYKNLNGITESTPYAWGYNAGKLSQ